VAVAARDRTRAEAFAAERGIAQVHDTYADVIADPDVDLVYNALVNSLHAQWNIAALQAGKHVLSEKPLTSNAEQARAVQSAAQASSGRIAEGFHYLHHPVNVPRCSPPSRAVDPGRTGDRDRGRHAVVA
jgi:predicted dehydrogenase